MSTYATLRDRALGQVGLTGQTEAQTVAQTALEEAMKFVAFHVRVPSLISSATATAPASPQLEANAIAIGGGGFGVSATFAAPDRLYVKKNSSATGPGTPYTFYEYDHFLDLTNIPSGGRVGIFEPATIDEKDPLAWTITPSSKVWSDSLTAGNVLTLFFRTAPAAYSGSATPEIDPLFDWILVNGAVIAIKEWLREPEGISTLWSLFDSGLTKDVQQYDLQINSRRKRSHLKIHRSYRPS